MTEPALRPIRSILPNLGGIDISPVILIIALMFLDQLIICALRLSVQLSERGCSSLAGRGGRNRARRAAYADAAGVTRSTASKQLSDGRRVLKVRVRAAASEGEANAALTKLVARTLGVPSRDVSLVAGASARLKRVRAAGAAQRMP